MYSFYRRRVLDPCGRCNYSCAEDSIQCVVCGKWYHRKCLNITKKKCQDLKKDDSFVCTKKCEFTVFPFHQISDKAFIMTNQLKSKFPCHVCTAECHRKMERMKCVKCLRWAHLQCIDLERSKADYIDYFLCSTKCELGILPFNNLDSTDFNKLVSEGKNDFRNYRRRGNRGMKSIKTLDSEIHSSEPTTQCEYLEPSQVHNVVNDKNPHDLTIFHGNVSSLPKNKEKT